MKPVRVFGIILTIFGVAGLIYTGYGFLYLNQAVSTLVVYGITGFLFFLTGVGLIKNSYNEI